MDREIEREFDRVNLRIDSNVSEISDLRTRTTVSEQSIIALTRDVKSIKADTRWILRLLVGGILVAMLSLIIKGG